MSADCTEYMGKNIYRHGQRYLTCSETFKTLAAAKAWLRETYLLRAAHMIEEAHAELVALLPSDASNDLSVAKTAMHNAIQYLRTEIKMSGAE